MAQALLGGLLPAIYSGADQLKRGVYGLLTNPQEQAERTAQSLLQSRAERQALMAQTFANPDRPFQVTDQAGLAQLTDQVMSGELGFAPAGITAFHGSPYRFNKFDSSKIGSGEGAQAYGHGMYFAESPDVARSYSSIMPSGAEPAPRRAIMGREVEPMTPEYKAAQLVDEMGLLKAKKFVSDWAKEPTQGMEDFVAQVNATISTINKKSDVKNLGTGNFYKVDIPDEYIPKMIDWDKPLKDQPKDIQEWFEKIDPSGAKYKNTGQFLRPYLQDKKYVPELEEMGYKGIKYLDEESRPSGKGTSNFVIFDPTDVKILERNNQPVEGLLDK